MYPKTRAGFTLVELMVVIAILGLLVSVLAFAVTRHFTKANAELDKVNVSRLYEALQSAVNDPSTNRKLSREQYRDAKGREFFEVCFKEQVLDRGMLDNIVSLGGSDLKTDSEPGKQFELKDYECSLTAPKMSELRELLRSKERKVLFTFNSNNWGNYDSIGFGTLVLWSDGTTAEYLSWEDLDRKHNISEEEWNNPESLFGEKGPFDSTYE